MMELMKELMREKKIELIRQAYRQTSYSYAPYSHFHVGAALLALDGQVFVGSNVENASFGAGICAERNALFGAVAKGVKEFSAIAVVGGGKKDTGIENTDFCYPCGICLQAMAEFCGDDFLLLFTDSTAEEIEEGKPEISEFTLKELLPYAFRAAALLE